MSNALTILTPNALDKLIDQVIADKTFGTAARYRDRLRHFAAWLLAKGTPPIDKSTIADYKKCLVKAGYAASTINGHLTAVRALLREAADLNLIDAPTAERAARVKDVAEHGARVGNWLSAAEAQALIDATDRATLKGKRDRALLGLLVFCGLRRSEIAALTIGHLQTRDGHAVIADLLGKGGRVRTIKLPAAVARAINEWLKSSKRARTANALVFVAMRRGDHVAAGETITPQAIYDLVKEYGARIDRPELAPHDLRRTFAKLAQRGNARLEDISMTLGHARLTTTQIYLGLDLNLENDSAPDRVGMLGGRRVGKL